MKNMDKKLEKLTSKMEKIKETEDGKLKGGFAEANDHLKKEDDDDCCGGHDNGWLGCC